MDGVHRLVTILLIAALAACDPAQPIDSSARPTDGPGAGTAQPELPAADPIAPSVAGFTGEAASACATAAAVLDARPLRGDPLAPYAKRRDVRAAVQHYSAAARGWSAAAETLFAFGTPEDPRGQRLIAALDVVAMRFRQVAEALAARDEELAQSMLGAAEQAWDEADTAARDLGLGPLSGCGQATPRLAGRQRIVVDGVDFGFRTTVAAIEPGATRLVLRNRGVEKHQLFVVPLKEPGTLRAAVAADRQGEQLDGFLAGRGAATAVARPGERMALDVQLAPGSYGFLCFVASPDGTPHAFKGMAVEVTVRA